MRFVLPLPPNMLNSRTHWRKRLGEKNGYWLQCLALYGRRPKRTFARATISAHFYLWNLMDDDNCMARMKFPLDFLVNREYIADDSRKVLTWTGLPEQTIDRSNQRLEIELTEDV